MRKNTAFHNRLLGIYSPGKKRNDWHLVIPSFDFNKPEDARRFLKGLRMPNGNVLAYIEDIKGKLISIDRASSTEICDYATKIFNDFYNKKGSQFRYVEPAVAKEK